MVTITLKGFKSKEEAIAWLEKYEGEIEQSFYGLHNGVNFPSICDMEAFDSEMEDFESDDSKTNFDLHLL